jgi:hypothetical protein
MTLSADTKLKSHANIFLETGTFHGAGVSRALLAGFSRVISIEVFEPLYKKNLEKFKREIEEGKVELYLGDSGHVIGSIVEKINEPIFYWFDAHDQTMNDAGVGELKCPIIQELNQIIKYRNEYQRKLDILIIDDMRLIEKKEVGWNIDMTDFYSTIWRFNKDFRLTREHGFIPYDILRCEYKSLLI